MTRPLKLATVLATMLVLFGLVFGAGQVAADSRPGQFLYPLKLAGEDLLLQVTSDPEAKAQLTLDLVGERLDEIEYGLLAGEAPDLADIERLEQQLDVAEQAAFHGQEKAPSWAFLKLYATLYVRKRDMQHLITDLPEADQDAMQPVFRKLERKWERTRQELQPGMGTPDGEERRVREGTPPDASELPNPEDQPGPGPGPQATYGPGGPNAGDAPGAGTQPEGAPAGSKPDDAPAKGETGQGSEPAGPGNENAGPDGEPGPGPHGTPEPNSGSGGESPGKSNGR